MCTLTRLTILPGVRSDRDLRADGRRQDRGRDRARRAAARRRGGSGRDLGRRAAGLRRPRRSSRAPPPAEQRARLEHRLVGFVPVTESFSAGAYAALAHAEIDAALAAGRRPIVVGGTGLYLRAALAELDLRPPAPRPRARRWQPSSPPTGPRRCTPSWPSARPRSRPAIAPSRRPPDRARARAARHRRRAAARARRRLAAVDHRHPPPDAAGRPRDGPRRAARAHRPPRRRDGRRRARSTEVVRAAALGASATARQALGFEELLRGRRRGDEGRAPAATPSAS